MRNNSEVTTALEAIEVERMRLFKEIALHPAVLALVGCTLIEMIKPLHFHIKQDNLGKTYQTHYHKPSFWEDISAEPHYPLSGFVANMVQTGLVLNLAAPAVSGLLNSVDATSIISLVKMAGAKS